MNRRYPSLILVTLIMLVSACAQPPATTKDESPKQITDMSGLYGIWQPIPPTKAWREYRDDGTFQIAGTRDNLEEAPFVTGEYWFEGNVLCFKEVSSEPEWECGGEQIGQYEIQVLESGEIKFVKVKDECSGRAAMLSNAKYKKVGE
jgi:hypothetical protein